MDQVIIWASGLAGMLLAAALAWRWRRLPLMGERTAPVTAGAAARDGLRVVAASVWAGVIAGVLVPGLGGRLLMRIMAATSGPGVQGRLTDAGEIVGEITLGGTVGLLVFVGLFGGLLTAALYPFVRRWLPGTAGPAGVVIAIALLGVVGVSDPLSPDNSDFRLLQPRWLAVLLVVVVALVFGVTFAALAARLDQAIVPLQPRRDAVVGHLSLLLFIVLPLAIAAGVYVAGRAAVAGRSLSHGPLVRRAGWALMGIVLAFTAARTVSAVVQIMRT